ncbi:hypothetical protein GCM10009851_07000 [Herbiconiux moechotypicola]|uniref:SGNH hydrolase-type esterase domain-containing protein n=1 Tax=Herbiconiux moechotypicola TaxID=637393 RepID=A0ABN3DA55_9MICO
MTVVVLAGFTVGVITGTSLDAGRPPATVGPADPEPGARLERQLGEPGRTAAYSFGHTVDRVQTDSSGRFEAGMRLPFELAVDATAFRVHVSNGEFDAEEDFDSPVSLTGVWLGEHLVSGAEGMTGRFAGPAVQLAGTLNLPAGGAASEWVEADTAALQTGVPYLLALGFTTPAATTLGTVPGLSWLSTGSGSAAAAGDESATPPRSPALSYLDVWIEYRFTGDAPVLFAVGHSLNAPGSNRTDAHPTRGESTAWPQQWAQANAGVAVSLAAPGSLTSLFARGTEVWREYEDATGLSPDVVTIWAASNDIARGRPLADIQRDWGAVVNRVRTLWPEAQVVAMTEPPRRLDAERESVRVAWNAWLATAPYGVDRVIDADGLLRDPLDPSRLRAEVDADGIHFTELGHSLLASQLAAPRSSS